MSYPHRIRLRGPWDCEPLARVPGDARPLPPACRMTMPRCWSEGGLRDFAGRVRFRRRFGHPTLAIHEHVWLTCAGVETTANFWLNGQMIGQRVIGPFALEVTALLQARNELIVEVDGPADSGGLWGEVALEVRCSAFLQDLTAVIESVRLRVDGNIVGTCSGPLELYAVLDGHTVAYEFLSSLPESKPFSLHSEELSAEQRRSDVAHTLRLDLVNLATVWYQWEQSILFPR